MRQLSSLFQQQQQLPYARLLLVILDFSCWKLGAINLSAELQERNEEKKVKKSAFNSEIFTDDD